MRTTHASIVAPEVDKAGLPMTCTADGQPGTAIARIARKGGNFVLVALNGTANPSEFPASSVTGI